MTANNCPRCYTPYDHCTCSAGPSRKAGAITPAVIKRATGKATIRAMLAGVKRPEFPDTMPEGRHIDTGRVNVEPYVQNETAKEYQARKYRERKARR